MAVKASGRFVPPSAFAAGTGKAFTGAYAWNAPREAVGRERPLTRDEMRQVQGVLSTITEHQKIQHKAAEILLGKPRMRDKCRGQNITFDVNR